MMKELRHTLNLTWWKKGVGIGKFCLETEIGDSHQLSNIRELIEEELSRRSVMCPRCLEDYSARLKEWGAYKTEDSGGETKNMELHLRCGNPNCRKLFIMVIPSAERNAELDLRGKKHAVTTIPASPKTDKEELSLWASAGITKLAIEAFSEGCHAIGCNLPRSACTMFRACLEKMLENSYKDYDHNKTLYGNIENLGLSDNVKSLSHAIRRVGNEHAHFNFESMLEATLQDAQDMLVLVKRVARELYLDKHDLEPILARTSIR